MPNNLVVVESPAKARTIEKYLGPGFQVLASYGHVQDLVPKDGAVDTEGDYALKYQVTPGHEKHLRKIASALKDCEALYLASDPDREGEAISWSLYSLLNKRKKLGEKKTYRVVFHEVTPEAVRQALEHPRDLSDDLVNAYQARRAIDYLVGFNLSPLLWRKIAPKLSAGRVQSPALRLIVERENEIEAFQPREFWTVDALLDKDGHGFPAKLHMLDGKRLKKFDLENEEQANAAREQVQAYATELAVASVERKERKRNPAPPFTTSTLQQEASRKLRFSARRTMQVAQQLYEGVDLGSGPVGLITYMRTDSVTLATVALNNLRQTIKERYGEDQMPPSPRRYKTRTRNAQEAHEAVRPTDATRTPEQTRGKLSDDQQKLYELVWKRAVACQMIPAVIDQVSVDLDCGPGTQLRATGSHVRVPGFMQVYREGSDEANGNGSQKNSDERYLPELREGERVALQEVKANQHFTEPPPRYTEASLVKTLEEYGIGRPSTYADTLSTLVSRKYAELDKRTFFPTALGKVVCNFLTEHFSRYVDYEFTAQLEDSLDRVARGETEWIPVVDSFWKPFHQQVNEKSETVSRQKAQMMRELGTDPESGKPVRIRVGRYGPFVQVGDREDEEKPRFASLREGQSFETITFEEAMDLLVLPRSLGVGDDGELIEVNIGRFGPYVKYGPKKYVSLPKGEDPMTVTREQADELIAEHRHREANRTIQDFGVDDIQVLNGRYGPYVTNGKRNAKIPKGEDPAELTLEQCQELLAAAPPRKRRASRAKRKS
ncbi:MAG: type I DNA topoisomerase [Gammaproteobacteria bacterium]|nr:type I DNA topoisomerase [Gammaproteobacteria bacterium]